ncbi:putative leucine--tRNA ligase [Helianthus debilis subsp. tardiflorus]
MNPGLKLMKDKSLRAKNQRWHQKLVGRPTSGRGYGLSDAEVATYQDPVEWLRVFPPLAVENLKAFGLGADWRRLFITTDSNPFFDKFVRWQMRKLKSLNKIPCADHDQASGEGVMPQEYTLIKMEAVPPFPSKFAHLEGKKVYLAAATLRSETMYGQTNAWVLPDGKYGAFEINEFDVFILTERAARNLAFQGMSRVPEKATCIVELAGQDLIGLPLRSPLSLYKVVFCLPMLSILIDKGTGIVTSVPSDSPDEFIALQDLKAKAIFRARFGVKDEWVLPFEVIPIIRHPEYAGMRVQDAKNKITRQLLDLKQGVKYSEPEKKVMSRSGDECVVALTDQWYLSYGEEGWLEEAKECLANMNLYSEETRTCFENTSALKPEQLTDDVWVYIFLSGPEPKHSDISWTLVKKMRQEFRYWYPVDLHVSGKDLIQNHLTFATYKPHSNISQRTLAPRV